ncbi:MAG TPA: hypothetical protein VFZ21_07380 [Gemmatimonadaceae bacterium]|nr:hypothetical protein [Gemmatimonadaceae bacterium]
MSVFGSAFAKGLVSLAIALSIAFLPFGIEKLRERRAAPAISVVASPGETDDGQPCRGADSTSARLISDTRLLASATDSAWTAMREELEIPHVDSSVVSLVQDDEICRSVLSAFNSTLPDSWPAGPPTHLYVVKAGTVYVGMVPRSPDGSVDVYAVTDARFEVLSKFAR